MPISGTSTDYTGRKKDIHVFQGVNPATLSGITVSFGKISNFCAGVQKLIQRFAISLLTEIGSQENYPTFGTNLLPKLNNRSLSLNKADVYPIFNNAAATVITNFREYQANNPDMPDDEKLNTALLTDVLIVNDQIQLKVTLTPISTAPIIFLVPLPQSE